MNKQEEIIITDVQLNLLLTTEEKKDFDYLLNNGVYCTTCDGICSRGVEITQTILSPLNDIRVTGSCRACGGRVTRIMEFGEDQMFYAKANKLRQSLGN